MQKRQGDVTTIHLQQTEEREGEDAGQSQYSFDPETSAGFASQVHVCGLHLQHDRIERDKNLEDPASNTCLPC